MTFLPRGSPCPIASGLHPPSFLASPLAGPCPLLGQLFPKHTVKQPTVPPSISSSLHLVPSPGGGQDRSEAAPWGPPLPAHHAEALVPPSRPPTLSDSIPGVKRTHFPFFSSKTTVTLSPKTWASWTDFDVTNSESDLNSPSSAPESQAWPAHTG